MSTVVTDDKYYHEIGDAIRFKNGKETKYPPSAMAKAIEEIPSGGIIPSGSVNLTEEGSYDVTEKEQAIVDMSATRAALAEAVTSKGIDTLPDSSFDTIVSNICLIGGGLPSSISKMDEGEFTLASDTVSSNYRIPHNLGVTPKFVWIWCDQEYDFQVEASNYFCVYAFIFNERMDSSSSGVQYTSMTAYRRGTTGNISSTSNNASKEADISKFVTPADFCLNKSDLKFKAGYKYKWLAWV